MKRTICLLLVLLMSLSMVVTVLADGTTTLTTTVPAATYTLTIPDDQVIEFRAVSTRIAAPSVTDSSGFAEGKNLDVTVTYGSFTSETVGTKIPFTLRKYAIVNGQGVTIRSEYISTGDVLTYKGKGSGEVAQNATFQYSKETVDLTGLVIEIESTAWGKALAGDYSATITFTSEVVAGNH